MFKLESYVTPWLLGYLDQYVKLRPEDLQLSLWGGDAALYNLDLRLDVLQKAMQLPIVFKSGHIHELKLHVPWTRLGWEPMVITINTVECIVKVRDTAYSDDASSTSGGSTGKGTASAVRAKRKLKRQPTEDLPPGYLQSILNRVVNNVTFIVNNLILKFVEDDIVLSVNVKSAECYSCDRGWNRAFVDLTPQDLVLRRMINFSDLTICLDKTDADGHIENYQEPMLYRCFITCRLHMTYESVNATLPTQTKLNVMCERLDALMSDTQLPMFLRLIELCLALYYGYLEHVPSDAHQKESDVDTSAMQDSSLSFREEQAGEQESVEEGQGWGAWMWSMVPQILPEDEGEYAQRSLLANEPPVLSLGFYIQQATLTFKVTEHSREKSRMRGGQKLSFHPFLVLRAQGVGLEILMQGLTFFNVQCGIRLISFASLGPCICGQPADASSQQSLILRCGAESGDGELTYDWGSLFDPSCEQNRGVSARYVTEREEHLQHYTELYGQQRFGAFWMDYLSTLVLPHSPHSGSQSSDTESGEGSIFQQEMTTCRFVFGSSQIQVTSSSVHRIHKVLCYAWNHHYEPYKSNKTRKEPGERVQVTEAQLAELEEQIPTCTYHVTLLKPSILLSPASHPHCNIPTKVYSTHSRRSRSKTPGSDVTEEEGMELCVSAQRFDLQLLSPMYPGRLVKLVSNVAGPSSNLLYHCHSHTQLKVFSLQVGLQRAARRGITWRPVILIPPCSAAFYFRSLLLPHLWTNSHLPVWERSYEVPQVSMTVSKASIMAATQLLASWTQSPTSTPTGTLSFQHSLLADLFPQPGEESVRLCVVELSVCGLEARGCHTPLVQAYTGSLSSLQLLLYTPGGEQSAATTVPILYGPVDSSHVGDQTAFQQQQVSSLINGVECMAFTVQKPHHTSITEAPAVLLVSVEGIGGCLDPALLQWFSYTPRKQVLKLPASSATPAAVDVPLAQATSPLQTGSSHMSVRSGSSHTQPTTSRLFSHSHSPSRTRSHPEGSGNQGDSSHKKEADSMDGLTKLLISAFPLLRMMQVQMDVKSSCVFVPKTSVGAPEASGDIAAHVQTAWRSGEVGEVVVVCLPAVSIHSVANSPMDVLQDIPITTLHGALISEKLPWTVELSEWSTFTLHPEGVTRPLMSGLSVSSTVGANVHYNPPTSDIIHSLALCLHTDVRSPLVTLSHSQIGALSKAVELGSELTLNSWHLADHCIKHLVPHHSAAQPASTADTEHGSGAMQQMEQSSSHMQQEASVTGGTPDVTEAVTTDVSDEASHLASPLHAIPSLEGGSDSAVKVSIWLQCVLPKLTLCLLTPHTATDSGEVSVVIEDLALSCDIQQVYCKVKTTVGGVSIHSYTHSVNGDRVKAAECPVLVSTSRELPHLHVHSGKVWSATSQPVPCFSPQDSFNSDKIHRFFTLTYTRALCKNVRRKMKKMNVELTSVLEREDSPPSQAFYFSDFVSEVCVKMEPLDVVLHLPTLQRVLALWRVETSDSHQHQTSLRPPSYSAPPQQNKDLSLSLPSSHTLPLLHMDIGALRLFIPEGNTVVESAAQQAAAGSTLLHDFFLLQWTSLHVQPHADNPLPRYPLDHDLFAQAMHSGMTQQTGSCVEDKQFQMKLHGLALSSGVWGEVIATQREKEVQSEQGSSGVQIPALEWNNYLGHRPSVKEVELIPMVTNFDLCLVVAPPIAFLDMETEQYVVVCGSSTELNVVTDLDLHLSSQQLCLLSKLTDLTMALPSGVADRSKQRENSVPPTMTSVDSGVASEVSAATHPDPAAGVTTEQASSLSVMPANILLTAGRISLTLYSHLCLKSDRASSPAYSPPPTRPTSSLSDRHQPARGVSRADNFTTLTRGMPVTSLDDADPEGCVAFSFIKPQPPSEITETKLSAGTVCVQPFVYVYITQPHTVLSTWSQQDRLELSCYDVLVKGVRNNYIFPVTEQRVLPDHADFSVYWVETRAGQPDSKTGIPPCLLTLQVSSLLTMPVGLEVKLERPLKVSLCHDTVSQVTDFIQQVSPDTRVTADPAQASPAARRHSTCTQSSDTAAGAVQPAWLQGVLKTVKRVALQTEQVVLSYECQDSVTSSGILTSAESIGLAVEQLDSKGPEAKVQGSMCWKDVTVKTAYNKSHRALAGPVTVEMDAMMRLPGQGQATPPQVVMGVQAGLVLVHLGQEHVMCLRHILARLTSKTDSAPSTKKPPTVKKSVATHDGQLTVVCPSHDDLRSGSFAFLHNVSTSSSGDDVDWPLAGQAVFSRGDEDTGVDSTLTWAYAHPRVITSITTLPIPFGLHTVHTPDLAPTVQCKLQHWDECVEEFVTYTSFELSEDSGCNVHLPQVRMVNVSSLSLSRVWRVVLCKPASATSPSTPSPAADNTREGVLLASQLAGSMCVDSVSVPSLVPSVQLSLTLPRLQLQLYNHLHYNGAEVGGRLAGYKLSRAEPLDQQWGVMTVSDISLLASHITGPLCRTALQLDCEGGVEVMDYNTLHMQSLVDPVPLSASLTALHHPQKASVQSEVNSGVVQCHVGRSVLHTINTSVMAWNQFGEKKENRGLVLAHLIVCNNTQQTLRFGQAGTDESVVLQSGHMYPYSWRSSTVAQQLHLCLDHPTWRWCAPLDMATEGHAVRVVRARDQRYTLIIQITQLSPVHKQVTVSGQFIVCSRLSQAVEVRFQLQEGEEGEGERVALVEAGKSTPSFVVEHGDITGFSVRLAGLQLPWSHPLHLSGNAMHTNQLIKLLLPDGASFIHIWCRIFSQPFTDTRQKLIFLSPLYVLRSHLPLPLHVRLLTPRTKQQQMLEVKGQGHEYQLHCTGGDVTHQLSFQLAPQLGESSPPVVLSTGLVDQVDQAALSDINIQALCQELPPSMARHWPYTSLQPSSACEEKRWSEVEQAGVDINVQLSQYLPGCNTLLVDISPWCLLTNLTPLPLLLLTDNHRWALPQGCTVAPPALKELRLGCEQEGQVWEGTAIPLSEDEVEQHRYSPDLGKVLYLDGQVQLQLLLPSHTSGGLIQVIPLSVVSVVKHGMRVVTVVERLRLSNLSGWPLQARLMAAPQTGSKLQPAHFNLQSVDFPVDSEKKQKEYAHPLLNWQLLQHSAVSTEAMELVLYMSLRVATDSSSQALPSWSVPVRVVSAPEGCRSTVGVARGGEGGGGSVSLCVSSVVEGAMTYVVVSVDSSPVCWIHNLCPFPLHFGQGLDRTHFTGVTVQEETELVEAVPVVASGGWSHYTMPHVNTQFPRVDPGPLPRIHVRAVLPASQGEGVSGWSAGVALDAGDTFLHMKGVANIKVNIQRLAAVYHVTFSVLNKAEVSAKEVRSRIQGAQQLTRVEEAPSPPTVSPPPAMPETSEAVCLEGVVVRQPVQQSAESWLPLSVGVLLEGVVVTLHDDVSHTSFITQLLQVELQRVLLTCYPVGGASSSVCAAVCVGHMQVENPLAHRGLYDFPLILQPQHPPPPPQAPLLPQQDLTEVAAVLRSDSFMHVQLVISRDPLLPAASFVDSMEAAIRPLSIYFEDSYFFRLYQEALCLVPHSLGQAGRQERKECVPSSVWETARLHQQPLRICHLCVQPVSLLLSVHASVRLFLATDHAPLTLGRFERHNLLTGTQQLAYTMAMHYITAAIFRAGMVVGSMDLLGSPTGLVRSVSAGLSDLVRLPYQGLTRSPAAFVTGVFGGVSSLMRNVTAGMMTSVTNFASSVSRNMDRLSLDSSHQQRQEESRRQRPTGLSSGLHQGLTGFGLSLLGAVAGLVDQPLQSVLGQEAAVSASSTAGSIMAGVGKGLVGVITKPIGGAAEFVSRTGQGILQGSGLRQHMGPRRSITEIQRLHLPVSWLKYPMKLLAESSLLAAVSATQEVAVEDAVEDAVEVVLLLTGDMVVVVSQEEDAQQQAFALSQLNCHALAPAILALTVANTVFHTPAQMLKPSSDDRIAAFINSTTNLGACPPADPWISNNAAPATNPTSPLTSGSSTHSAERNTGAESACTSYHFRMDPHWCQLFVALFHMAKNRQMGRGFFV